MEKHRCQKDIGRSYAPHYCAKPAKYEHEGKWYCGLHYPPAMKARRVARDRKWQQKWDRLDAEQDKQGKIREAEDRLVAASLNLSLARSMDELAGCESVGPLEMIQEFEAAREALLALRGASLTPENAGC